MLTSTFMLLSVACSGEMSSTTRDTDTGATGETANTTGETGTIGETDVTGETDTGETDTGETDTGETDGGIEPIAVEMAWFDLLAGPWSGPVDPTPVGPIPTFPMDYQWQMDGSLHSNSDDGQGSVFEFTFTPEGETWTLLETGQLPGDFFQSYTLHPVEREGNRITWVYLDSPEFLSLDIDVDESSMEMSVAVMGQPHAVFSMMR